MQNWKSYGEISCVRLITIPAKNENFDIKKWFQIFFFGQASSDYKKLITFLQQQGLSHHGDASGGSIPFDSISTNKERLTNTFSGYHSEYHNLFQKFVFFPVQAFWLHIFLGTIEINLIVLTISSYLKGKVLLILKHEPW